MESSSGLRQVLSFRVKPQPVCSSVSWPCSQPGAGLARWACSRRACVQVMFEVGFCMGPSGIHLP